MTPEKTTSAHLTQDEFDEALLGEIPADRSLHLAGCAECRAQLEPFHSSISLFNQASNGWSQARSNALNRDLKQHRTPFRLTSRTAWACASMLVLFTAATVGIELRHKSDSMMASQAELSRVSSKAGAANAENEIASDDAMLREIDAALNISEPSPEKLYGIKISSAASAETSHQPQVRD